MLNSAYFFSTINNVNNVIHTYDTVFRLVSDTLL